jgi:ureidoglycolate lyase
MVEHELTVEPATPESVAPYGRFIGVTPALFAEWAGVKVFAAVPVTIGDGGELLHVAMAARELPVEVELLERHFKHSQTYLSANGKPFIMVMGDRTSGGLPDFAALRAFEFRDGTGIALDPGIWHEFPIARENDTRFTVILRAEAHVNMLDAPEQPMDARGPDLERYDMAGRATIRVLA